MMQKMYSLAAWTPRPTSLAKAKGRMYRDAPSEWGTQSRSTSTMALTAWM